MLRLLVSRTLVRSHPSLLLVRLYAFVTLLLIAGFPGDFNHVDTLKRKQLLVTSDPSLSSLLK